MGRDKQTLALASVALGAAILGLAPVGMRLSELGPQATAFWRFAFALPLLAVLLLGPRPALPAGRAPILALAGLCFGLDIAFWHAALARTSVLNATLASNMTPIIAAAFGWFLLRQRLKKIYLAGAGVALAGAMLLSFARASGTGAYSGASGLVGDGLGLVSALWYAAYLIILDRVRGSVSARAAMFVTTCAAALFALAVTLSVHEQIWPRTAHGWFVLAGLGLVVHAGGQGLIAFGLGRLPIALTTITLWIQPIAAAALSWFLFGEHLTFTAGIGAVLVLFGVWMAQRARTQPPAA